MKTIVRIFPFLLLVACQAPQKEEQQAANFLPPVPQLASDIMTPEVLWSFGRIGNQTVSPDGSTVAFTVTYYNIPEDKSYSDIYVVKTSGGEATRITDTPERETGLQWRPDGSKIGYLSAKSGSMQLWEVNSDGTAPGQISDIADGIDGFRYSQDGTKVAYIKKVKLDQDIHDLFPDLPKANARLENDLMYRHWDSWHDYTYNHIFVADIVGGKLTGDKDILEGERFDSPMKPWGGTEQFAWSPDGKTIAYTCQKLNGKAYTLSTNSDIWLYNLETGTTANLTEGMPGYDRNPKFSPDGKMIAWESMARDGYEADQVRLFTIDVATGEKVYRTAGYDQNAEGLCWSAAGDAIYFLSAVEATDQIHRLTLADNQVVKVTDGIHNYESMEVAGDKLLASRVSMSAPAELYLVDTASGSAEALTSVTQGILSQLSLATVEKRMVKTSDDKEMLTWVIYPPKFDPSKKYPAILYCQGGPQSTVSQFWSYRWNFQMMAAMGYIVVAPNRRGVPGFGQAWNEQISGDYGGQNIRDLLAAIDDVAKEPYVDSGRLGAVGASYGGFAVNYLAGHHDKRFKAFISHCGIFNFDQQYLTTEEMWFENFDMGGPYWDKNNAVAQKSFGFSPHKFVDKWDTPILVIHGGNDFRIPYTQGMAAFNAAVLRDIPAQFLFFPEETHWVLRPQNGILWQRVFQQWLDKYLKS